MTAADTVREALDFAHDEGLLPDQHERGIAALDVLQAQAERDAQNLRACVAERDEHETRVEAAEAAARGYARDAFSWQDRAHALEAERDQLQVWLDEQKKDTLFVKAERDRLAEQGRIAAKRYGEEHERRVAAEAERDGLADALQRIADGTWTPTTGDSISPREFARAALAQTEQPQPSESGRFFREPQPDSET